MRGWGYAVFGRVVDGMEVVDAIVAVPTTSKGGHQDVPVEPIVITGVREITAE
jgi:peptidyl-prolyl cis-trans isomerase B (cyclophilin B)